MNVSLPLWRTPFHPGWLLLLVPSAAALFAELAFDAVILNPLWYARLVLAGVILLPLVLTRNARLSGVPYRWLKEMRMHLPGCLVAFLGPGLFGLLRFNTQSSPDMGFLATLLFLFGGVLMLSSAFGREFEQGTLSGVLTQPVSRGEFFLEKLMIPGVLTLLAGLNLVLMLWEHSESLRLLSMIVSGFPLVLMILVSGPYFSLVSRGTLPAVVFSMVVPHVLGLVQMNLKDVSQRVLGDLWYQGWFGPGMEWLGALVYSFILVSLAWRRLDRLELDQEGARGRSVSGVNKVVAPLDGVLARALPVGSALGQLVRKELGLHVIPWLAVALQLLLAGLVAVMRWMSLGGADLQMMTGGSGLLGVILLLGIIGLVGAGAAVVAEERELGTLDWQLTQPVRLRTQWMVKLGVALLTAIIAGVFLPYLSLALGLGWARFVQVLGEVQPEEWFIHAALGSGLWAASVYASSACRSTVGAMVSTLVVAAGLIVGFWASVFVPSALSIAVNGWQAALAERPLSIRVLDQSSSAWAIAVWLYAAAAVVTLGMVSYCNFKRGSIPLNQVVRQATFLLFLFPIAFWIFRDLAVLPIGEAYLQRAEARAAAEQKQAAVRTALMAADRYAVDGVVPVEATVKFGFSAPMAPQDLVRAVEEQEGVLGLQLFETRLSQPTPQASGASKGSTSVVQHLYQMDPALLRRYGLLHPGTPSATGGTSRGKSGPSTNAVPTMDPVLMKRYGLEIVPTK